MEAILHIDQAIGGEDVHVGMEAEVITKGVDHGNSGDLPVRQIEGGLHPELEGFDGLLEEVCQELAAFAKDAPDHFGNGEDIHAMGNIEGNVPGDPIGGFQCAALMA